MKGKTNPSVCGLTDKTLCTFSYTEGVTPQLSLIVPRSAPGDTHVQWYGVWRMWNTENMKKMFIGD